MGAPQPDLIAQRAASVGVAVVFSVSGLALLGWIAGSSWLTAWRPDGLPMAPSTVVLALLLGVGLVTRGRRRSLAAGLAGLGALVLLTDRLRGIYSPLEHLGFSVQGSVGTAPVGFISPITATAFVLAAVGIGGLGMADRGRLSPLVPGLPAALLFVIGFSAVLLNVFGVPLLLHSAVIPPALNTSVLIAALGLVLVARLVEVRHLLVAAHRDGQTLFVAIGAALICSVVTGAYAYYLQEEQEIREATELELDALSRLQAQQIHQWRRERLADGAVLRDNAALRALVARHLANRRDRATADALTQWLDAYDAYRDYDAGWVIDANGEASVFALGIGRPPSGELLEGARHVIAGGAVDLFDFYPSAGDARPRMALVVPLADAAVVLRIDPEQFLLPLVETWPNANPTGETLLVRTEGDEVVILSRPRFGTGEAMAHRLPATDTRRLAFRVAEGATGVVEGLDYHGARALAVLRPVASSPWVLITKVDVPALDLVLWERFRQVVLSAGLLMLVLSIGLAYLWQRQRTELLGGRAAEEARATRLAQLYAAQSACNEAIIRCTTDAALCARVCEVAVTKGGLAMAWVGMLDEAAETVVPVASYGQGTDYVAGLRITTTPDDPDGRGPTGTAVRSGHAVWSARFGTDAGTDGWRDRGHGFGWTASGAIPLRRAGRVVGALSVYTTSDMGFDTESQRLLTEMAANVSFALDAFDQDARRREAEARLAENADYYETLFAEGGLVRLLIDPATGRIVEANAAAVDLYGWDLPTLTSMTITQINAAGPEVVAEAIARAGAGAQHRFEFQHRTASGRLRDVEVFSSSLMIRGRRMLLSTILDVTEQKQLEAQFLQAQKMEVVGRLASGVAHDFNNLLTVINGTAGVLIEDLPPDSPLRSDLDAILQAGARAAQLTSQLLAFSRRQQWVPVSLDVGAHLVKTAEMVQRLLGADVKLQVSVPEGLHRVVVDPGQLDQVVLNLSVNARDAMPNGGLLTLAAANVVVVAGDAAALAGASPGPHVCLTVRDTGTGMSDDVRARLFEPFFTTKEVGRGTGLGLTTVFGIVKHLGGAVTVETTLGRGTSFMVWLPGLTWRSCAGVCWGPRRSPSRR